MVETKAAAINFDLKEDGGQAFIAGYASTFNTIDGGRDIVHPSFFDRVIDQFKDEGLWCLYHDFSRPIGKPVEVYTDSKGLFSKAAISDVPDGKIARTLAKDKVLQRLSFSYDVAVSERLEKESDVEAYWRDIGYNPTDRDLMAKRGGKVRLLQQAKELYEISPVPVPMNRSAAITAAKAAGLEGLRDGLPFDDHASMVLDAVEAFKARAAELADMRADQGRLLSEARRAQLKQLCDHLNAILAVPDAKVDAAELDSLFLQYQQTVARLNGVGIGV